MTETAYTLAQLCNLIYDQTEGWDDYWSLNDVVIARSGNTLVLRGSVTTEDWLRDGDAVPIWHAQLGFVHRGFLTGMDEVYAEVKNKVQPGFAITGHSLGGARARILAALFAVNGMPPARVVTFGSPKPAFINLRRIFEKSPIEHISYRNRNDVVPMLPPLSDFVHTESWTAVDAAPAINNLEPLRDHSMELYCKALTPATSKP